MICGDAGAFITVGFVRILEATKNKHFDVDCSDQDYLKKLDCVVTCFKVTLVGWWQISFSLAVKYG